MMRDMTANEELVEAREVLARDGWVRNLLHDSQGGGRCAYGALNQVIFGDYHWTTAPMSRVVCRGNSAYYHPAATAALLLAIGQSVPADPEEAADKFIDYNNEICKSEAEMLSVFDRAIAITAGLDGPSRTIIVEPIEQPAVAPEPAEPEPAEAPEREPEKVPA